MQFVKFKLSSPQDRGCVSCDESGPKVGNVRLMKRTLDDYGNEVWAPRDADTLNALLTAHYRFPIEIGNKIEGLQAVARALNKDDFIHARFVTLFLQFPDLPPNNDKQDGDNKLLTSLWWSGLLKADEDWDKKHPRTGEPPNRGWFAPVPKENQPPKHNTTRRWPSKKANDIIRDWAKNNPPSRVRLGSVYVEIILELLRELSPDELNQGEDLLTAQLYASHDPPKTLDELRLRPNEFPAGYERHHIVEQNDANRAKFGDAMIDDPDNIVWVPRLKHEQITAEYNGLEDGQTTTLRGRLRTEDFETQREKGLELLRKHGVLK